ncbi:MAG: SufD family Fe-S cluster assembly protein [Methanocellales archaeon]|nr:SufD family Fe-S cluster assembly protein [Methanocellales archaeon]
MPEISDTQERAHKARDKPAALGPDINLDKYSARAEEHGKIKKLKELAADVREKVTSAGVDVDESHRSGSFFQIDHSVIQSSANQKGIEVMSVTEALEKYDWLKDYWWKNVAVDMDKYTAQAELKSNHGYFVRALAGAKVQFPVQACLFIGKDGLAQNVHNIIIAEEGSELHIITGCTTAHNVKNGLHVGVSEFYVKRNAHITFTMIHNWAKDVVVRPRTGTIIEENGVFLSNYICMKPVRDLQMYPTTYCAGKNATVRYNTILYASEGSNMDVGSRVFLKAKGSKAELIARAISKGGNITARGHLIGEVPEVKAHLECRGLILSENGKIHAIPELEGLEEGVDLSHEAAVGKIAEEEIQYLMARGLNEEESAAAIVRGFLDVDIKGLPQQLQDEMKRIVESSERQLL